MGKARNIQSHGPPRAFPFHPILSYSLVSIYRRVLRLFSVVPVVVAIPMTMTLGWGGRLWMLPRSEKTEPQPTMCQSRDVARHFRCLPLPRWQLHLPTFVSVEDKLSNRF